MTPVTQQVGTPRAEEEDGNEIDISLCGNLIAGASPSDIYSLFEKNKVTFEQFCEGHTDILADPNLVVRIEDHYYDWKTAAPSIISMLAFKQ